MRTRTVIWIASAILAESLLGCGGASTSRQLARGTSRYLTPPYTTWEEEQKLKAEAAEDTPALTRPTVHLVSEPGSTHYSGPYRFAQPPLVIVEVFPRIGKSPGSSRYSAYIKLNRDIPDFNEVTQVMFDGHSGESPVEGLTNYRPSHCYSAQGVEYPELARGYIGKFMTIELFIAKKHTVTQAGFLPRRDRYLLRTRVPVHRPIPPISSDIEAQYFRAIACKPYLKGS